jgi:hypothetical protein
MFDEGAFLRTVGRDAIGQILFSEPLQVEQMDTLEETAAFVSTRLVMPAVRTHRYSGAKPSDALRVLRRHFRGLIQSDRLRCDFSVPQTMSSVPRSVRFFSAVEEGVTLEMAHLAIADRSEAIHRADAAAFKAQDLLGANPGLRLGLLCSATTGGIEDVSCSAALQIIEGAGVEVVADFGAAVRFMVEAAGSDEPDWARWSARSSPIPDELNLSSVALLN